MYLVMRKLCLGDATRREAELIIFPPDLSIPPAGHGTFSLAPQQDPPPPPLEQLDILLANLLFAAFNLVAQALQALGDRLGDA